MTLNVKLSVDKSQNWAAEATIYYNKDNLVAYPKRVIQPGEELVVGIHSETYLKVIEVNKDGSSPS
jgi:hypothetical protein